MPSYTWINNPPVEEIPLSGAASAVTVFQNSLRPIATGYAEEGYKESLDVDGFGEFTATKAYAAIDIAEGIKKCYNSAFSLSLAQKKKSKPRVFGYKLDGLWVGLIHIETQEHCVYIDHVVGHAGTENAGDILIEHILHLSPVNPPVVELFAASEQAFKAYEKIGFKSKVSGAKSGGMKLEVGSEHGKKYWAQLPNGKYKPTAAVGLKYLANV